MQNTVHYQKVENASEIAVWLTDDNDQQIGVTVLMPCTAERQTNLIVFEYPDFVFYPQLAENQDRWQGLAGWVADSNLTTDEYKKVLVDLLLALSYSQDPAKQRAPVETLVALMDRKER